eukprot:TRINITY_DN3781_c0_g1_i1.p1 TRINITY_DN3781_c0_g1~~TRINITY_DN3781_c0_g1_i1.p1  ORF type:complete len:227 (+),score=44.62 TRINITY_DN3781_c0_g1_i1:52-681(+)
MARRVSERSAGAAAKEDHDYAEEGRRLLAEVGLMGEKKPDRYSPCNALWRNPKNGATLFVGGQALASDRKALRDRGITRIVNCQDRDGKNYFQGDAELKYLRFEIGLWRSAEGCRDGGEGTRAYFEPMFRFVTENLRQGHNVLVHCLAGAHRAGTAGISLLMLLCGWDSQTATANAKALRPAIEPIGGFPILLAALDKAGIGRDHRAEI